MSISSHMQGEICVIQVQQALSSDIHVFLKEKLRELMREIPFLPLRTGYLEMGI